MGGRRGVGVLSVRELVCALAAVQDALRRCGSGTPSEREAAGALAEDERAVLDELRRRRGDGGAPLVVAVGDGPASVPPGRCGPEVVHPVAPDPDARGVTARPEREEGGEG